MPSKRINHRLIKIHRSYSIDEVTRILHVHKNTVRGWIKSGLSIVDQSRPTLILGSELRRFLEARRNAAKRPCPPGTLYCLKCRQPMPPALGMVEYVTLNDTTGNLIAFCRDCETMMYRRARLDTLHSKLPNIDVQIREAQRRLC